MSQESAIYMWQESHQGRNCYDRTQIRLQKSTEWKERYVFQVFSLAFPSPEGKPQGSGLTVARHTVYCHTVVGYTNMEYANLTHLWPIRGPRAHASKSYTTSRIKGLVRRLKTLKSMRQQITQRSFRNLSMLCTDASCRPFHPLF